MTDYPDQADYWEQVYARGGRRLPTEEANQFAVEVALRLRPGASVLELGCGPGSDSAYFARQGFVVIGTDVSPSAIAANSERYASISNLTFETVDISQPLPFTNNSLDTIYARLSLHYFTDTVTRAIIAECRRVLTEGGLLCFLCKSIDDPLYGKGDLIEPDMYCTQDHVRHFFSEDYARTLLATGFLIQNLDARQEELYGKPAATILCIAAKI